ncbi:hypothetical protein FBZ91_104120 [Nitrospirillum viridazoti]|nr:hypothetical protein FBZ91_104120 [Nitrospirillum amazonense]
MNPATSITEPYTSHGVREITATVSNARNVGKNPT